MLFHKSAAVILCAGFVTQAGVPSADPLLPVPRPAPPVDSVQDKAQTEARPPALEQALQAKEIDANKAYRALIKR